MSEEPKIRTKIGVRPFVPSAKDEELEGREPFAVLAYGGVVVELDYTIMRSLSLDIKSNLYYNTVGLAHAAFNEILKEMEYDVTGSLSPTHRDGHHPFVKSIERNPLHPINKERVKYEPIDD